MALAKHTNLLRLSPHVGVCHEFQISDFQGRPTQALQATVLCYRVAYICRIMQTCLFIQWARFNVNISLISRVSWIWEESPNWCETRRRLLWWAKSNRSGADKTRNHEENLRYESTKCMPCSLTMYKIIVGYANTAFTVDKRDTILSISIKKISAKTRHCKR